MSKVEEKVVELKEELKDLGGEVVVKEDTKGKKILKWGLNALALTAAAILGFVARGFIGKDDLEDETQEEKTEE